MTQTQIFQLWAKLGDDPGKRAGFHPLICHMLDVAAVTHGLWHGVLSPAARRRISAAFGLEEDVAGVWASFLAGLHDLGKASPAFQLQDPSARNRLEPLGLPCPAKPSPVPHGTITAKTLPGVLQSVFGMAGPDANTLGTLVGGHHGTFPTASHCVWAPLDAIGDQRWQEVRHEHVMRLATTLGISRDCARPLAGAEVLPFAGLVSVADWIGSNADYFPYAAGLDGDVESELTRYWKEAQARAHRALDGLGWTAWPRPCGTQSFQDLFPDLTPRPVQRTVEELAADLREPGLAIIEAPMGEGKTEAALYLVEQWNALLGQQGSYVALPTQATSNQMFGRVRKFLSRVYTDELVNLQLLHGHAALSAEFELLRLRGAQLFQPSGVHGEALGGDGIAAAEWFTHRKRGLLAPFGVGTVDQALMAVLQSRHVFVRLFGLAHKVVVIDEVHAYDTYMTALITRLLEWLGALGSPVVLLSATLPRARRARLLQAYRRGLGFPVEPATADAVYPRVSWVTASAQNSVSAPASAQQTVRLRWTDAKPPTERPDPWGLAQSLRAALEDGGCAVVICNTVARAQQLYLALKPHFPPEANDGESELDLLHARFPFEDREARERRTLVRFGKPGPSSRRPRRAVLVATQIVEQSLDLDFDLMATELAPVDLILQRMGRLHRHSHSRLPALTAPTLWVLGPRVAPDGCPDLGSQDAAIYDLHVLLRSWLALRKRQVIQVPDDLEPLIETAYDEARSCPAELSDALRVLWEATLEKQRKVLESDQREAEERWLKPPDYDGPVWRIVGDALEEDAPEVHPAHQALTRLAEPSVPVVLLHGEPEAPALDLTGRERLDLQQRPSLELTMRLLRRSVPISGRRLVFTLLKEPVPPGWRQSPMLRHHRAVFLDRDRRATLGRWAIRLDDELGLVVEGAEPGSRR